MNTRTVGNESGPTALAKHTLDKEHNFNFNILKARKQFVKGPSMKLYIHNQI